MQVFDSVQAWLTQLTAEFGLKVLGALALVIIGIQGAGLVRRLLTSALERTDFDKTLTKFLTNIIYYAIIAFVGMAALNNIGVETASLIALVGAAGLAAGLALEGALSNFAAGVLLIVFRPLREGDWVNVDDMMGKVIDIQIVNTVLLTFENETVIIPNSQITDGQITNYSRHGYIEHEMYFYVDYSADIEAALDIMQDVVDNNEYAVSEPRSMANVLEQSETAVKLILEANIDPAHREQAQYTMSREILRRFKAAGIPAPYQRWRQTATS